MENQQYIDLVQNLVKSDFKINQFSAKQYIELLNSVKEYFPTLFEQLIIQNVFQNILSLYQLSELDSFQQLFRSFYKITLQNNTFIQNLNPEQQDLIKKLIVYGLEKEYFNFSLLNILAYDNLKIQQIFSQVPIIYIKKLDEIEFIFRHVQNTQDLNYVYQVDEYEVKQRKIKSLQQLSKVQTQNDIDNLYIQLRLLHDYSLKKIYNIGLENVMAQVIKKISLILPFKVFYKTAIQYISEFDNIINKQLVYQLIVEKYMDVKAEINIKYLENILLMAQKENIQINNLRFDNVITRFSDSFIQQYHGEILKNDCNFNTKAYVILLKLKNTDIYALTSDEKIQNELLQFTIQFNQYSKINDILIFTKQNSEQITSQQYDNILQNLRCLYTYFSDNNQLKLTPNLEFMILLVNQLVKGPYNALQNTEYHEYIPNIMLNNQIASLLSKFDLEQTKKLVFLIQFSNKQQLYFAQLIQAMLKVHNAIKTPQVLLENSEIIRYDSQGQLSQQKIDIAQLLIYLQQEQVFDALNIHQLDYLKDHIKYLFFKQQNFWQECNIKKYCYYLLLCYIIKDNQLNFQIVKYFIQKLQQKNSMSQQSFINYINQGQGQVFLQKTEIKLNRDEIKQYFQQIESCYEDKQFISIILTLEIANEHQVHILRAL